MKIRSARRRVLATLAIVALALGIAPGAASASPAVGTVFESISGVGSSWSAQALTQWISDVKGLYQWRIEYSSQGSSAGRQLFAQPNGGFDFAVSEIPYQLAGSDASDPRPNRSFAYMPIVAGGTAFMYNLVIGGKRVTNLRLSGQTVSQIFTGAITKWNDPAIAADNPKLALPAIPIVPVVRSDGSGTSAQFSSWMRSQYPQIWSAFCVKAGRPANCGITSNYPAITGFKGQPGSDGVAGYVAQPQYVGSITYVEYSYALTSRFPVAKILNSAGYYVEPKAAAVAVALLGARINTDESSPDYLTQKLDGVYTNPDPRSYPLSSYSYMLIPTALEYGFTEDKGLTLAAFANYFLCKGQQKAEVLGYSPLPINLAQAGLDQVLRIPGGDPQNIDIRKCDNPTFTADGSNRLAQTAPQPQACDKKGSDQCLTGTGGAATTSTVASGSSGGSGSGSGAGTGADGETSDIPGSSGDEGIALAGGTGPLTVAGSPTELPVTSAYIPGLIAVAGIAAAFLILVFGPPLWSRRPVKVAEPRGRRPARSRVRLRLPNVHLPSFPRKRAPGPRRTGDA